MNDTIFIEKYRPQKFDDIIGQDSIIKLLRRYVETKNMPHLLFAGSAGCGKTTSAIVLAKEMYGNDWRSNFKELNSSDNRGIDVVRHEIKEYASTACIGDNTFKMLLLDESDSLTNDAQNALRRTMERFQSSCKFILSCNYSSKIIEPIQSRCAVYRFSHIGNDDIKKRLLYIASKENLKKINDEILDTVCYVSEGDLRKAVNLLETVSLIGEGITIDNIYKLSGIAHPKEVNDLINKSLTGEFVKSINSLDVLIYERGLSGIDICKQMFREVINLNIKNSMKIDIIDKIGETDFRISEGADEGIQMKWLITQLIKIGK